MIVCRICTNHTYIRELYLSEIPDSNRKKLVYVECRICTNHTYIRELYLSKIPDSNRKKLVYV
jgi:ribosomal protein S14